MQFQVPQFIETEDHIVGPLSLKQFFYIAGAAGVSFMLYFIVASWLWFILSLVVVGGAASLSFVKVNGRPLVRVLAAAANYYWKPQRYVWLSEKTKSPKSQESLAETIGDTAEGISLEKIISGFALKSAQLDVEVGAKNVRVEAGRETDRKREERYGVFEGIFGERKIAKRVDYR
ncbi:MAG TPA: PrgI family protein [Candidatus Paceibacterota bacterium]